VHNACSKHIWDQQRPVVYLNIICPLTIIYQAKLTEQHFQWSYPKPYTTTRLNIKTMNHVVVLLAWNSCYWRICSPFVV
jgi:hypothetical protein